MVVPFDYRILGRSNPSGFDGFDLDGPGVHYFWSTQLHMNARRVDDFFFCSAQRSL